MGIKKARTAAERRYHDRVRALGCMICGKPPQLHHVTYKENADGTYEAKGMSAKASHMDIIPLCISHHLTGGHGVALHAGTETWEDLYGTQAEMLEKVKQLTGI